MSVFKNIFKFRKYISEKHSMGDNNKYRDTSPYASALRAKRRKPKRVAGGCTVLCIFIDSWLIGLILSQCA